MSRIRSLHPGQWTDEAFVSCSMAARLLALGLRNEADDHGIFEWKPLQLKMRLFPADDVNVGKLLDELAEHRIVARYVVQDRALGIIRNFGKYQSPRRPSYVFPTPEAGAVPDNFLVNGDASVTEHPPDDVIPDNVGKPSPEGEERRGVGRGERKKQPDAILAFSGRVIRLSQADFDRWRTSYGAIPDLRAELESLDAYYAEALDEKEKSRWFVRCSTALAKKHQDWSAKAAQPSRDPSFIPMHPGAGG